MKRRKSRNSLALAEHLRLLSHRTHHRNHHGLRHPRAAVHHRHVVLRRPDGGARLPQRDGDGVTPQTPPLTLHIPILQVEPAFLNEPEYDYSANAWDIDF